NLSLWTQGQHTRSEPARDEPEDPAGCQVASVIVDTHREQARSYNLLGWSLEVAATALRFICHKQKNGKPKGFPFSCHGAIQIT
ncbi:hypothetical protein, partial [Pseudomonas sp. Sample_16]|uniref:hypothetical protein n=1 Tax=Pseudomonas sp. Sample_16 TaxID=2448263 RepID=UPI0019D52EC2